MARLPQPPALWVGYNVFRLTAVIFMLWCLITQFISLADEIKMLKQLAALQGTSTMLPTSLNATATGSHSSLIGKSAGLASGSSSSSTSSASRVEFSTAYSEFSVTSATTIRRVSTIPPSSEPTVITAGRPVTEPEVAGAIAGGSVLPPTTGTGAGDIVAHSPAPGSDLTGSSGSSSPLIGGGETLKRRRWVQRSSQSGSDAYEAMDLNGAATEIIRAARPAKRANDGKAEDKQKSKSEGDKAKAESEQKPKAEVEKNQTETANDTIGPWRPEVLAADGVAGILVILMMAQIGIPEVWLHDNLPYIGPQSTPILLGAVQSFVSVETLRAPGQALNLIGAWGVMGIGCFHLLSGALLWHRARRLPPDPPPALWFSHAVRLLYSRPLPPFYAPLFRTESSADDQEAWADGELDELEEEKTTQNTLANSQMPTSANGVANMEGRHSLPNAVGGTGARNDKYPQKQARSTRRHPKGGVPGQIAAAGLLSDIALGPTSQDGSDMLGAHTLNGAHGQRHPMSTGQVTRYDLDPEAHADVRQGGYPTFTGTGLGQAGRQIPAGTLALDPRTGEVTGLDINEEEEEVAVVKMAERVSMYDTTSAASAVNVPRSTGTERKLDKSRKEKAARSGSRQRADGMNRIARQAGGTVVHDDRPETVHSLLPPVNILPNSRDTSPIALVPGARPKPASSQPSRSAHRRTPSIGKQGVTLDGSHRVSDHTTSQLAPAHGMSSVATRYSGLPYDRTLQTSAERPRHPRAGQGLTNTNSLIASPFDVAMPPRSPLRTASPTPTPVTPVQMVRAQTGTVKTAGQYTFPPNSQESTVEIPCGATAERSRGKRGTVIGSALRQPVELDMSDSEEVSTDRSVASGHDRRTSTLEDEIRDLLSPPLARSPGMTANRQSILPPGPGSLTQHIKAIEQQQEQQKQLLSARQSPESGRVELPPAQRLEEDPDRPPSALKGSSSSLTPPRERPPRHLRFALSPIPATPVSAVHDTLHTSSQSQVQLGDEAFSSSKESAAKKIGKSDGKKGRSSKHLAKEEVHSASIKIPGLGMTLALPAGLVEGISPTASPISTPRSAKGGEDRPKKKNTRNREEDKVRVAEKKRKPKESEETGLKEIPEIA